MFGFSYIVVGLGARIREVWSLRRGLRLPGEQRMIQKRVTLKCNRGIWHYTWLIKFRHTLLLHAPRRRPPRRTRCLRIRVDAPFVRFRVVALDVRGAFIERTRIRVVYMPYTVSRWVVTGLGDNDKAVEVFAKIK